MFSVQIVICVCIILIVFALIIKDVDVGKYNIKNNESIIAKEAEENYLKDFPKYTIKDLKIEIEKIADILIDNQESNRYTDILREKVKKDYRIKAIKDLIPENVELMKYNKKTLRARVEYNDYNYTYFLVLDMEPVTKGRVFVNDYYIFKK